MRPRPVIDAAAVRRPAVRALVVAAVVAACAPPAPAVEAQAPRIEASSIPDEPVQGRLFQVLVAAERAEDLREIRSRVAGQPLHFREVAPGRYAALAATPIDTIGEMTLPVVAEWSDGAIDSTVVTIQVRAGDYRHERLTVAPGFGSPPDSALQARMRRESERAGEVSRLSHSTPRLWDGEFVHPRPSRITSGFGHGREYNGQITGRHMGTDFAGAVGAPVHAPARGIVALVDQFHLGGGVIYIDHGAGLVTAYLHLSEQLVSEGDFVEPGQLIGRVGATGRVTGPHLHWIVRYGTITVDPLSLLEVTSSPAVGAASAPDG